MKFPTGGSGQEFEKLSEGTHLAVCNMIVDVGLQPGNPKFAGMVDKKTGKADQRGLPCPTVYFRLEVPAERVTYQRNGEDVEGPMTIYVNFRASMNEKANLRKAVGALAGKVFTDQEAELFDIETVLGRACMITVAHSEDGKYANVKNFMALPKGTPAPKAENPLVLYSSENDANYDTLPKFLREKIDNQLGAGQATHPTQTAVSTTKTTTGTRQPPQQNTSIDDAFADAEAERQASKARGVDPDDELPF